MSDLKLYSFFWDCGRMGELDGMFIASEASVHSAIGKELYFGEVLGKHSEVFGTLNAEDVQVLSDDQDKIEWLQMLMDSNNISGFNPLNYLNDEEDV